jgi:hypothetical protein
MIGQGQSNKTLQFKLHILIKTLDEAQAWENILLLMIAS